MIPLKINGLHLVDIMAPDVAQTLTTDNEKIEMGYKLQMYPTEVSLTSETYSKDTSRTANYEMSKITLVNRKSKPEFIWDCIRADYVKNLLKYLCYKYNFKNAEDNIVPEEAYTFNITYIDFIGARTIKCYLGQTIEAVLEELQGILYWRDFRLAFPEL